MPKIDANEIVPGLYQGGKIPSSVKISRSERYTLSDGLVVPGFDVVVLCAKELQPHASAGEISAPHTIHAPLEDGPAMTDEEKRGALWTAQRVVSELRQGKRVLVTCAMGLNRSGLIVALVLCMGWGLPAQEAIQRIRARRNPNALFNPYFQMFIAKACASRAA